LKVGDYRRQIVEPRERSLRPSGIARIEALEHLVPLLNLAGQPLAAQARPARIPTESLVRTAVERRPARGTIPRESRPFGFWHAISGGVDVRAHAAVHQVANSRWLQAPATIPFSR
jgi:hypothetical protein